MLPSDIKHALIKALHIANPWNNLRVMGTNVGPDLLAGVTVAVIALPLALAFGVASGLGPATGMWAAICGCLFVGVWGGSKVTVSGPTGPMVVQLAAVIELTRVASGEPDLNFIFTLVFLSGLICVGLAFARVGHFIHYVPYSAISGFMCGIGVIIISLEIPPMLGFSTPSSVLGAFRDLPANFWYNDASALLVSAVTLLVLVVWPHISPVKWLPSALVGLLAGSLVANLGGLDIEYIPAMATGLPQPHLPDVSLLTNRFDELIGPACALAGLCVVDSLLTCLIVDNVVGDQHNSDKEVMGQGMANMACGLLGGVNAATATMTSVANAKCGARTGLAAVTAGVVLLSLMLGLAPLVSYVPMACLAGILFKVGFDILDYRVLPVLHRLPVSDAVCFWAVLGLTVSVDLLVAMGVGVTIAFMKAIHELGHMHKPLIERLDQAQAADADSLPSELRERVVRIRLQGPLFFGVADSMHSAAGSLPNCDYLILDLTKVPLVDMSGAYQLDDIVEKAVQNKTRVLIVGARPEVERKLAKLRIVEHVGRERCFLTEAEAIAHIYVQEHKEEEPVEATPVVVLPLTNIDTPVIVS